MTFDIDVAIARDEAQLRAQLNSRSQRTRRRHKPGSADRQLQHRLSLSDVDNRIVEITLFKLSDDDPDWPQLRSSSEAERSWAGWLDQMQAAAQRGDLNPEMLAKLNEKLPGWQDAVLDLSADEVEGRRALRSAGTIARDAGLIRTPEGSRSARRRA